MIKVIAAALVLTLATIDFTLEITGWGSPPITVTTHGGPR